MENHLGRLLDENEIVHHKDGNKKNNDVSNLEVMTASEHASCHARMVIIITFMVNIICQTMPKWYEGVKIVTPDTNDPKGIIA